MSNPDSCQIISKADQWFLRRRFFKNFFMSVYCKKPSFTRAMFKDGSKFREHYLKRVTQGTVLWNYFKLWPVVLEKKIFYEFLVHVHIVQEAPIQQSHVYGQMKISRTNFKKGSPKEHSCEIISKSDQRFLRRRFFKNFFMSVYVQKAPIHQSHVYGRIKILRTHFKKGHTRNIPVKLFQNLTCGFGEEFFLTISSSCPNSARSPHSPEPCLWTDQNFANKFWKGSPKEHSCEIIIKSDQRFLRRFFKNFMSV